MFQIKIVHRAENSHLLLWYGVKVLDGIYYLTEIVATGDGQKLLFVAID